MKLLRIIALCWIIGLALWPTALSAGDNAVVTITAQPWATGDCPTGFTFNAVSSYEVQLAWTPGGNSTGTVIRGAYARWPTDPTDGFEVYNGNGSSASHWLTTDVMILSDEGIYYRLWGKQGGSYSLCYASGVITGGEGMANISGSITLFALIVFSLGSVVTAYTFRKAPIAFVAAAAWTSLAFFCFTQSASSNPTIISDYWMAIFWVGIAMVIVSVFEPVIMKAPSIDEAEPVEARSQADEMRAEYEAMQKEMGVGIFKPRARKHRKLPKNW
jgi:hypothetical protein